MFLKLLFTLNNLGLKKIAIAPTTVVGNQIIKWDSIEKLADSSALYPNIDIAENAAR